MVPSSDVLISMTTTSKTSKMKFFTCIQYERMKAGVSFGLVTRQADRQLPLNLLSQHHSLLLRNSPPRWLNPALLHLLLPTLNVAS